MVDPGDVERILYDAARLVRSGRIVVFGSSALAFWLDDPPASRDVDVWVEPPDRGEAVEALMGEMSWYDDRHGAYVEVWGPETFAAPEDWETRARSLTNADVPDVTLLVPHPHDILLSKLERWEEQDRQHARQILAERPLTASTLAALAARCPHRTGAVVDPERCARFERGLRELQRLLP